MTKDAVIRNRIRYKEGTIQSVSSDKRNKREKKEIIPTFIRSIRSTICSCSSTTTTTTTYCTLPMTTTRTHFLPFLLMKYDKKEGRKKRRLFMSSYSLLWAEKVHSESQVIRLLVHSFSYSFIRCIIPFFRRLLCSSSSDMEW